MRQRENLHSNLLKLSLANYNSSENFLTKKKYSKKLDYEYEKELKKEQTRKKFFELKDYVKRRGEGITLPIIDYITYLQYLE